MTAPLKPRHNGWTPRVRAAFLDALATTGMVRPALEAVSRGASAAYALRRRDPGFRAAWDAALAEAVLPVETMLVERALAGEWVRTVDEKGKLIASAHRFDNRFALRLLTRLDRRAESLTEAANSLHTNGNPPPSAHCAHKAESRP